MRKQNGQQKIQQNEKCDEFWSKIHCKFKSNLNLPSDLYEKYTAKFYTSDNLEVHQNISIQFNGFSLVKVKSTILA